MAFCSLLFGLAAVAQQAPDSDVLQLGPGVTTPKLTHKQEPTYSDGARAAHVQGAVLLQIVVDEQGFPQDITVLSPLGFGLDEKAIEAVSAWRFKPGQKDGKKVKVRATVEVDFRFSGQGFDEKAEQRRTRFNAIASRLNKNPNAKPTEQEVAAIQDLASHKYAAASYALGVWQTKGYGVPKDEAAGLANIQKAADQNYGPAMFTIGRAQLNGDPAKGLALIRQAAVLGSREAQFMLGGIYEDGKDVEIDLARSERYFRLCAASGTPECQFKLGQLLIRSPQRKESDWLQGIAWLELAQGHEFGPAKEAVETEVAKLTPEQNQSVTRLRGQLERKD